MAQRWLIGFPRKRKRKAQRQSERCVYAEKTKGWSKWNIYLPILCKVCQCVWVFRKQNGRYQDVRVQKLLDDFHSWFGFLFLIQFVRFMLSKYVSSDTMCALYHEEEAREREIEPQLKSIFIMMWMFVAFFIHIIRRAHSLDGQSMSRLMWIMGDYLTHTLCFSLYIFLFLLSHSIYLRSSHSICMPRQFEKVYILSFYQ